LGVVDPKSALPVDHDADAFLGYARFGEAGGNQLQVGVHRSEISAALLV
jgi:hypothetical protein